MSRFDKLIRLPFELAYLALLTSYRIKHLSRWEEALSPEALDILHGLGLETARLKRRTLLGRRVPRVVFSRSSRHIESYVGRFEGKRLSRAPRDIRLEGWHFGYPSCCVEEFIRKPYEKNDLSKEDQGMLFHWACTGCSSTESLLRDYRYVHDECVKIFGGEREGGFRMMRDADRSQLLLALPRAASIAALALLPALHGMADIDPHVLPAPDDTDFDGLSYAEERLLGTCPILDDVDVNGIADGIDKSLMLYDMIVALPRYPIPFGPYAIEYFLLGLERCAVCGAEVNMGFFQIIHPLRGLQVDLPVIALHYLEHGSIGYDGDVHGAGRADIEGLKRILFPSNPAHYDIRYVDGDIDSDLLGDDEETLLETEKTDPDTDGDSLGDAPQVAENLLSVISGLPREVMADEPYIVDHVERGIETCEMCGDLMDMGYLEIVNPLEEMTVELPYVALHYLAHGSFGAAGDIHPNADMLPTVIDVVLHSTGGAHRLPIAGDIDSDGLTDDEEIALGLEPGNPDSDSDGIPDGPELAMVLYEAVGSLPECPYGETPPEDETYFEHFLMYGTYDCLICGEMINMGFMQIVDPVAGKTVDLPYYNYHFMGHGGFSTDRPDLYSRTDIEALVDILRITISGEVIPPPRALLWNAPNPFAGTTRISFNTPAGGEATVSVFDAAGRKVCEIFRGKVVQGVNNFAWNGTDGSGREVASGVYFCKIEIGSIAVSRKMLKIR